MHFKYKKYLYLVNDVTSMLLKRDREREKLEAENTISKLRAALIVAAVLLFISVLLNIYLLIK